MFENFLGDEARFNNREVYIIAGVAGNKGTLKERGQGRDPDLHVEGGRDPAARPGAATSIRDYRDLEVIAVNMPNEPGVRNVDLARRISPPWTPSRR